MSDDKCHYHKELVEQKQNIEFGVGNVPKSKSVSASTAALTITISLQSSQRSDGRTLMSLKARDMKKNLEFWPALPQK